MDQLGIDETSFLAANRAHAGVCNWPGRPEDGINEPIGYRHGLNVGAAIRPNS
ncbi:MAG TPA: hypothetical protein VGR26_16655 [Acidimicrobiales bacterium]|nr:hypothetical protein [Acidimicrobiales bacterium]